MNFLHSELSLTADDVVQVTLAGDEANVLLLDDANFAHYRDGRAFRHDAGGLFTHSPVLLVPPQAGLWHLVIDLGGREGDVQASVAIRPANETGTGS
jgi:hypothetical protein